MATTRFHSLTVRQVHSTTRDAIAVTFELPPELAAAFDYVQGQYLTLRTTLDGQEVRRSYSICSAVQDRRLRVAIKRVGGGLFSNWAAEHLRPGIAIDVMPPQGQFHLPLEPDARRHVVAFAAGSGITPVLSIVKTTLLAEPHSQVTLVYGNRMLRSTMFKEELEDLKNRYLTRLVLHLVFSDEHSDSPINMGFLDREKIGDLAKNADLSRFIL